MRDLIEKILNLDLSKAKTYKPEDLAEVYDLVRQVQGVLEVTKRELGVELLTRFEGNGMMFGTYGVTRVNTPNFAGVSLQEAEKYGAVKTAIDTTVLSQLLKKGTKVEGVNYTQSIRVSSIKESEEEDKIQ